MHGVQSRMYDTDMERAPSESVSAPRLRTSGVSSSRLLFRDDTATPLGALPLAGIDIGSRGVSARPMRVLGLYAVVLLLEGGGHFRDALGTRSRIAPGDAFLLFPEVPHAYGPPTTRNARWDEAYFVFTGPTFDALRHAGSLSPAHPVFRPAPEWRERLLAFGRDHHAPARPLDVLRFATLVAELTATTGYEAEPTWAERAEALLRRDLERPLDVAGVAAALDLAPDAFRKRFARERGITPARYRAAQRLAAAESLLVGTRMPLRAIAVALGFTDEFHLSRRFKEWRGVSPSEYRRLRAQEAEAGSG